MLVRRISSFCGVAAQNQPLLILDPLRAITTLRRNFTLLATSLLMACDAGTAIPDTLVVNQTGLDLHSYANVDEVRVAHVELDLTVLFDERRLRGVATLSFDRILDDADTLVLDTRALHIIAVESWSPRGGFDPTTYSLGSPEPVLGSPLTVVLPPGATRIRVTYETSPDASGLQWLDPEQTAGGRHPFMFTQSQAIHARSWIPLQDTPGVRVTYGARIQTPEGLRAVMSAGNDPDLVADGSYRLDMRQRIPSYLIALAVGDLEFRALGDRVGIYAEPSMIEAAAVEFEDTSSMIEATEQLYGPYRWERYDLLVMPPSFPFGGMENPRLTFVTPTILAGDKSLVALVAHELAHSWSGNLVTNATWRDFWLNEGFTVYIERRIIEALYGRRREQMEEVLGLQALRTDFNRLDDADQVLHIDLGGRDPDDGMTQIPYEKGALFLRHLEQIVGRGRFDEFLRGYFDHFAFQSITTDDFEAYLSEYLLASLDPDVSDQLLLLIDAWIRKPGVPLGAPQPESSAFREVEAKVARWVSGEISATALETTDWSTFEWLHFLGALPKSLTFDALRDLDQAYDLTNSSNAEIANQWLLIAIRNSYQVVDARLEQYLMTIGRRKLIRPLYEALAETPDGRERAIAIYRRARPGYHPISTDSIDQILGWEG